MSFKGEETLGSKLPGGGEALGKGVSFREGGKLPIS